MKNKNNIKRSILPILLVGFLSGILLSGIVSVIIFNKSESKKQTDILDYRVSLDIDSPYIERLISQYDLSFVSNIDVIDRFYMKDKTLVSDIDSNIKMGIVVKNISDINISKKIDSFVFNRYSKMLFGKNFTPLLGGFSLNNGCIKYDYINDDSLEYGYYTTDSDFSSCYSTSNLEMLRDIVSADIVDNHLEIVVAYLVLDKNTDNLYKDYDSSNSKLSNELDGYSSKNFDIRENSNLLHQYKYVYSLDSKGLYYYLDCIEKVQ